MSTDLQSSDRMHRENFEHNYAMSLKDYCANRVDYNKGQLLETDLVHDPIEQFFRWFEDAKYCAQIVEPNACILATVSNNIPSTRTVLIKQVDHEGFIFFSNYESQKAKDIEKNPNVSMTFYWGPLERQIHIQGVVEKVGADISNDYFVTRPKDSRIAAIISPQSSEVQNRDALVKAFEQLKSELGDKDPNRPNNWGGYRVKPSKFEFWQGRKDRLHDRIKFLKVDNQFNWKISRLGS